MILAGIDIGTNTLRLLIADVGPSLFREIHSARMITRLGEQLPLTHLLSPRSQRRSLGAIADFNAKIKQHGAIAVSAVGTSALRNARNAAEFIEEASNTTGIAIRVITGEEEARFTLSGVAAALRDIAFGENGEPLSPVLVVDIGGGSTEIIAAGPRTEPVEASLPLGAVYLTERFLRSDPPAPEELDAVRRLIRGELDGSAINAALPGEAGAVLAGTAGTITTLAAMDQQLADYVPERINRYVLTRAAIEGMIAKLSRKTIAERRTMPGLESGREDIILAGSIIIQEIMDRFGFAEMFVSDWGLREGIIFDLYRELQGKGVQ